MIPTKARDRSQTSTAVPAGRRRSWAVRVAVWVLFVAVAAGSAAMAGAGPALDNPHATPIELDSSAPDAQTFAADEIILANRTADGQVVLGDRYGNADGADNTTKLLPAWRWKGDTTLFSNYGVRDSVSGKPLFSVLASIMFAISAFVWSLLLETVEWGMTLNMVHKGARSINSGFVGMFGTLRNAGFMWFILLIGAVIAAKAAMRANFMRVIGIVIAIVVPLGAAHALAENAAPGLSNNDDGTWTTADGDTSYVAPKGSPAWIAEKGVGYVDQIGTFVGSGFGLSATVSGSPSAAEWEQKYDPNCVQYINTLYAQYNSYNSTTTRRPTNPRQADAQDARTNAEAYELNGRDSLVTVSYLWQRAFLANWSQAQFASPEYGARISCHALEIQNDIPAAEQALIAANSEGYPTEPAPGTHVFRSHGGKDHEGQMFGWAACTYNGSWTVLPEWKIAGGAEEGDCKKWWENGGKNGGDGNERWEWGRMSSLNDDTAADKATAEATEEDLLRVRNTVTAYWGHNAGERMLAGLVTLITSAIYAYALGGLAIGSVVAQLGLVIMLVLLPATLFLLAIPNKKSGNDKKGGGQSDVGKKMLKLTGGFFLGKLTLTIVMVLLLQSIIVLESILNGNGSSFLNMIIPLAALFIVKKILSLAGLGNLTSITGAVGMSSSAALAATGDRELRSKGMNAISNAGNKLGLDKADAVTKAFAKRNTIGRGADAAKWTGRKADSGRKALRFAERTGLADMRNRAIGRKNDDGEYTHFGALQRVSTLAGLAALASGAKMDKDGNIEGTNRVFDNAAGHKLVKAANWVTGLNPQKADKSKLAAQALENRKRLKLSGSREAQRNQIAEWSRNNTNQATALARSRDLAGRATGVLPPGVTRTADGTLLDEDGALITAGDFDEAGNMLVAMNDTQVGELKGALFSRTVTSLPAGFTRGDDNLIRNSFGDVVTDGKVNEAGMLLANSASIQVHDLLSDAEMVAAGMAGADMLGLSPEQVVVGRRGTQVMFKPKVGSFNGVGRTIKAKSHGQTVELARSCLNYIPDEYKKLIASAGLDATTEQELLTNIAIAVGGMDPETGAMVDWAAAHGVNLDTEDGIAQLELDQAGMESKFAGIKAHLSDLEFTGMLAAARESAHRTGSPRYGGAKETLTKARQEEVKRTAIEVSLVAEVASSAQLESAAKRQELTLNQGALARAQKQLDESNAALAQAQAGFAEAQSRAAHASSPDTERELAQAASVLQAALADLAEKAGSEGTSQHADSAKAVAVAQAAHDAIVQQMDDAAAATEAAAKALETAQAAAVAAATNHSAAADDNQALIDAMLELADVTFDKAREGSDGAKALEISSDLAYHDRKPGKISIGDIIDKRDDYEKDAKRNNAEWRSRLDNAKEAVLAAQSSGDQAVLKRAVDQLNQVTASFAKIAKDSAEKGLHANALSLQEDFFTEAAAARVGQAQERQRARDLASGSSPFPS